jgi:hypothetical protein
MFRSVPPRASHTRHELVSTTSISSRTPAMATGRGTGRPRHTAVRGTPRPAVAAHGTTGNSYQAWPPHGCLLLPAAEAGLDLAWRGTRTHATSLSRARPTWIHAVRPLAWTLLPIVDDVADCQIACLIKRPSRTLPCNCL